MGYCGSIGGLPNHRKKKTLDLAKKRPWTKKDPGSCQKKTLDLAKRKDEKTKPNK